MATHKGATPYLDLVHNCVQDGTLIAADLFVGEVDFRKRSSRRV